MSQISIYKPNSKNSGFAASFQYQANDKRGEDCLFAQLIKQHSWNPEKHIGSFRESMEDPTKKVSIKLEFAEIGAILDCLDRNRPFKTVHDDQKGGTKSIVFSTWMSADEVPVLKGYSFGVTINNKENSADSNKFFIGISIAEGRYLREFLIWVLNSHFDKELANRPTYDKPKASQPEKSDISIAHIEKAASTPLPSTPKIAEITPEPPTSESAGNIDVLADF